MNNIIAVIWDFDKTLVDGYMQDPIFEEYNVDAKSFWAEVNALPEKYEKQNIKVNPDTIYLNHFIKYAKEGRFKGLNNAKLREFGKRLKFYKGVPEIFQKTQLITQTNKYKDHNIKVEHYIVSTGMSQIIKGSCVNEHVKGIWGCELIEGTDDNGNNIISEIGYTIDNTTKTRALFEINKGVGEIDGITVNTSIKKDNRRVHFVNMIYVADGPSDIPAFSVVNQNNGATFAVYPKGDMRALKQVEAMRKEGRVNMFAEADYSKDSTAYMWLCAKIEELAEKIYAEEREKIMKAIGGTPPKHIV